MEILVKLKNENISSKDICEVFGWVSGMEEEALTILAVECLGSLFLTIPHLSASMYKVLWETKKYNSS